MLQNSAKPLANPEQVVGRGRISGKDKEAHPPRKAPTGFLTGVAASCNLLVLVWNFRVVDVRTGDKSDGLESARIPDNSSERAAIVRCGDRDSTGCQISRAISVLCVR